MAYDQSRREELARAKGFRSYREYRAASPARRRASTRALARRDPTYTPSNVGRVQHARGGRRQIFETPAGTIVNTPRANVVMRQLRRGDTGNVRVMVNVRGTDGQTRTIDLFSKGGWSADRLLDAIEDGGEGPMAYFAALVASMYSGTAWAAGLDASSIVDVNLTVES